MKLKIRVCYRADADNKAKELGYESYEWALGSIFDPKSLNYDELANIFQKTRQTIKVHLRDLGFEAPALPHAPGYGRRKPEKEIDLEVPCPRCGSTLRYKSHIYNCTTCARNRAKASYLKKRGQHE